MKSSRYMCCLALKALSVVKCCQSPAACRFCRAARAQSIATFFFALAYFTLDFLAVDMEQPFGFHAHALPLVTMVCRQESTSEGLLELCAEPNDENMPSPRCVGRGWWMKRAKG